MIVSIIAAVLLAGVGVFDDAMMIIRSEDSNHNGVLESGEGHKDLLAYGFETNRRIEKVTVDGLFVRGFETQTMAFYEQKGTGAKPFFPGAATLTTAFRAFYADSSGGEKPDERRARIEPLGPGELRIEPLFRSAAICFGAGVDCDIAFEFRKRDEINGRGEEPWRRPETPPFFSSEYDNWRGMFFGLDEDVAYEVRVLSGSILLAHGSFRTLASDVPVARTIEIDPATTVLPLTLTESGTSEGWVRYTVKGGGSLVNTVDTSAAILCSGLHHVLIDGLRLVGGPVRRAIYLQNCEDVRVRGCDISGFGKSCRDFVDHAAFYYPEGTFINGVGTPSGNGTTTGVQIEKCRRCVVERCWIHDPVNHSVAWRYYHPAGPKGITVGNGNVQTIVRHNDIVGSDAHRWDDAIVSLGNFAVDGGFGRSAEAYGNYCSLPNDDGIELDGGQQCVACWGNRFDGGLVGISLQGCMVSPSYVFDNFVSDLGDYFGESGQTIKTSSYDYDGSHPYSAVLRNVLWGDAGSGFNIGKNTIDVIGNVFCGRQELRMSEPSYAARVVRDNRVGVPPDDSLLRPDLPVRPLSFRLDTMRFDVGRSRAAQTLRFVGGRGERFVIAKNAPFDWFSVEPSEGAAVDGLELTVRFDDTKMHDAPAYRGSFLVRTESGLSRPVSVYASAEWSQPLHCEKPGDVAVYARPEDAMVDADGYSVWSFTAPREGRYYFMAYAKADVRPEIELLIGEETPGRTLLQTCPDYPVWGMLSNKGVSQKESLMWGGRVYWRDLRKDETICVRLRPHVGTYDLQALVMTDNPVAFEPKIGRAEK